MFETDDDFDLDEVMLDTVSIIEEAALKADNFPITDNRENKICDTAQSIPSDDSLLPQLKFPAKRKSDTDSDTCAKLQKRSSKDCLQLLESSTVPQTKPQPEPLSVHSSILDHQKPSTSNFLSPKPTVWRMKNRGNSSEYEIRNLQGACQRKFPGPAGLLPERTNKGLHTLNDSVGQITSSQAEIPVCSQPTQTLDVGPWQALRYDLQDASDLLNKYTVSWVKHWVATRRCPGQKIPFLAAVLHNVDASSQDPVIVLRDKTGVINGTVHRSVWESHGGQLVQGSALVLRLVGVACTGSAAQQRLYVNVTANNIVTIYSPSSSDGDINVTEVHSLDIPEIRQRIKEWEEKSKADAMAANTSVQNSTLFTSVLDRTPLRQITPVSLSTGSPRPTNPHRNNHKTFNPTSNPRVRTPTNPGNGGNLALPKTPNPIRIELPKRVDDVAQNKVVTSTQTSNAEEMSLEVSTFLEGLDTDLLFEDF